MEKFIDQSLAYINQLPAEYILPLALLVFFGLLHRQLAKISHYLINKILKLFHIVVTENTSEKLLKTLRKLMLAIGAFVVWEAATFIPRPIYEVATYPLEAFIDLFSFWVIYHLVEPIGSMVLRVKLQLTGLVANLSIKTLRVAVVLLAVVSILDVFGIKIAPIIAGFGLVGVAVALGAQDLFKNLIGGLLILAEQRFDEGDWIKAEGVYEGIVENIGFRSTLMRGFDKAPVYIPNNDLAAAVIINYTRLPYWRLLWIIGVEYSTSTKDLQRLTQEMEKMLLEHERVVNPDKAACSVRVDKFSDSSIDIQVICFVASSEWNDYLDIKDDIACRIKDITEKIGVSFAFPSRTIYHADTPPKEAGR